MLLGRVHTHQGNSEPSVAAVMIGVSGLSSVVMPRTDSVTLTLGLVVTGASAIAAGAGVAVTYLSADYAAAGCAGMGP
jgi:hypothetical protein